MTVSLFFEKKLSKMLLFFVAVGVCVVCSMVFAQAASAHGWIPDSRADLCYTGVNTDCGPVMYEPWSIEGRGDFPEIGVPDGEITGGGKYPPLYEQTYDRWAKVNMSGGAHTFHWQLVANHSTNYWDYYITRTGWDPNQPIGRDDLELFCRYEDNSAIPPDDVYHDCYIPNDRQGYYVIIAVWDIFDTDNAFYQAIDVNLTPDPSQPTNPDPGYPGDPNRFGSIPDWSSIRPYNAGESVIYDGKEYKARWWTKGDVPGVAYVWELIGDAPGDDDGSGDPGDGGTATYPEWDSSMIYTNEIVTYNGQLYQAQWWTQGQPPDQSGPYGPWLPVNP